MSKVCACYQKYPEIIKEHIEMCIGNRIGWKIHQTSSGHCGLDCSSQMCWRPNSYPFRFWSYSEGAFADGSSWSNKTFILTKGRFGHRDIAQQEDRQYEVTGKMALSKSRRGTGSRLPEHPGSSQPCGPLDWSSRTTAIRFWFHARSLLHFVTEFLTKGAVEITGQKLYVCLQCFPVIL